MKATMRNGKGSAMHNDRNYLSATEQEKNEIVSKWQLFKECDSFHENEVKAYEELFGDWLQSVNERKIKDRHPEKCKTMEDIVGKPNESKTRGKYEPVETILQIGKDGEEVSIEVLRACVNQFVGMTQQRYGSNMQWLDIAIHEENSSVAHAHLRRTWFALDEEGRVYPAKKEALKALGFDVLETDDRYNNATTRQTEEERQLWYEICREHGIELNTETDKDNTKHLNIKDYKKKKIEELEQDKKAIDKIADIEKNNYRDKVNKQLEQDKKAVDEKASKIMQDYRTDINKYVEKRKNKLLEEKLKMQGLTHELQFNDFSR